MIRLLESRSQPSVQLQAGPAGEHSMAHNAFQQLLQFAPLLDDADIKCRLVSLNSTCLDVRCKYS